MQPSSTVLSKVKDEALSASEILASTQEPIKNIDKTTSLLPNIQPTSSIDVDQILKTSILPDAEVRVNVASSLNSTLSTQKLQTISIKTKGRPTLSFINKTITQIQEIVKPSTTQLKDDKVSSHATYVAIFSANTTAILKPLSSSQPDMDIQRTVHSVQSSTLSIEPSKLLFPSNEASHIPSSVIEPDNINYTRISQSSSFAQSIDVSSASVISIEKSSYSSILQISPSISISKSIDMNTSVALDIKPSVSLKQNQSTIPTNSSLIESMQVESVQPSQSLISSFSMTLVEDGSTSFEHTMVIQSSSITSLAIDQSVETSPSIGTSVRSSDIDFSNVSSILPSLSSINRSFSEVGSTVETILSYQSSISTSFLFEAVNSSLMLESAASTAVSSNSSMIIESQSQTVQTNFNSETISFSEMYSTSVIEFSEPSSMSSGLGEIVSTLITSLRSFNQSISTNVKFSITSKTVSSFKPSSTLLFNTDMMSTETVLPSFTSIPLSITTRQTQALLFPTTTVSKGVSPSLQSSVTSISSNYEKALVTTSKSLTVSPSSAMNIYENTSIAVVPILPSKQITKDMKKFLHQDISKEDFANEVWVQNFISRSSNLWMKIQTDNSTEVMNGSLPLLEYLETVFTNVAKETKDNKRFTSDRIMVEVSTIKRGEFKEYSFHGMSKTDKKEWKEREGLYLPSNFFQQSKDEEFSIMAMEYQPLPVMNAASMDDFQVSDKVYAINVDPPLRAPFQTPFEYVINTKAQKLYDAKCVYWGENSWRTDGCLTYLTNTSMVICKCNHMTPFSVLMQVEKYEIPADHRFALSLITYVGCGMSVAACLILILSFMMCGQLVKVDRNLIHINLAMAIALSNALFIRC
uniref:GAIN-B domain-containing protein n=1 Tax=Clytia hemisphaerica TaxID=252671 RepID=A0A7M5URB7_9CNID